MSHQLSRAMGTVNVTRLTDQVVTDEQACDDGVEQERLVLDQRVEYHGGNGNDLGRGLGRHGRGNIGHAAVPL